MTFLFSLPLSFFTNVIRCEDVKMTILYAVKSANQPERKDSIIDLIPIDLQQKIK